MNKKLKLIISLLLCSNLITLSVKAQSLTEVKEKSDNVQQQIQEDKNKLEDLKNQKANILDQINALDSEQKVIQNEVNDLNLKIGETEEKINSLEIKAKELQDSLEKNKELMGKRFRVLYMNQNEGYVEMLFDSKGLSDLIERIQVLSTLVSYDHGVIEEFKKNQNELDSTIKETDNEKANLEQAKLVADKRLEELNNKREEKDNLVAKAEEDINTQESMMASKEEEFQQIVGLINQMEQQSKNIQKSSSKDETSGSDGGQVSNGEIFSITGGVAYPITSGYGWRTSPISGKDEFQAAVDIGAPQGAPVYSLMAGTVAYAGWMRGYGNVVVINHGSISSLYAHNSQLLVSQGQHVDGGQKISLVGSTGWATGPHIHFEVTNSSGEKIDPTGYYIY